MRQFIHYSRDRYIDYLQGFLGFVFGITNNALPNILILVSLRMCVEVSLRHIQDCYSNKIYQYDHASNLQHV